MTEDTLNFSKHLRLNRPAEYKRVFSNPIKSSDQYFIVLGAGNDCNHPRLGLAIAKKNIRKSVQRNVIKRAVRESFRKQQYDLGSIDIVVMSRKEAADIPPHILRKSLEKHWVRLVLRCGSC